MNTQSDFEELLKLLEENNEDLITNKKASGRAQDIADLEKLEQ